MKWMIVFINATLLVACQGMVTPKHPNTKHTPLEMKAQRFFWDTLHQGKYDQITQADSLLMAAFLENPNNPQLAAHIGFLHIWKIAERTRHASDTPLIVNEIVLAVHYFREALTLDPDNPVYLGFLGNSLLIEGQIFQDQYAQVKGYLKLKKAINEWPEFNYFTAGYPMSTLPPQSEQFQQGLNWQWYTLDSCAGKAIDRANPDYKFAMQNPNSEGPKSACWNSEIAPFNFEGFFMNMGDMLVKAGQWQTAIIIYKNAQLDPKYNLWPYKKELESRIANAKENVDLFIKNKKPIMFNSTYACMACHQDKV